MARFQVQNADSVADWYLSRDQFADYGFADLLLLSPALRDSLPELAITHDSDVELVDGVLSEAPYDHRMGRMPREPGIFQTRPPLWLDGDLAINLTADGPSRPVRYRAAEAKRLASVFVADVVADRYEDFVVQQTHTAWAPWFEAVAWDNTWLITDKRWQQTTLLCVTDDG